MKVVCALMSLFYESGFFLERIVEYITSRGEGFHGELGENTDSGISRVTTWIKASDNEV